MRKHLKGLITLVMIVCLSVASSMTALAGNSNVKIFGQQAVGGTIGAGDAEERVYKVIVIGSETINLDDINVNGGEIKTININTDNGRIPELQRIPSSDGFKFDLGNDNRDYLEILFSNESFPIHEHYHIYRLPASISVEDLGEYKSYVIYAEADIKNESGWRSDNIGWWYVEVDGTYPTNTWKEINGKYYYFGSDGYMLHDTTTPDGTLVGEDGTVRRYVPAEGNLIPDTSSEFDMEQIEKDMANNVAENTYRDAVELYRQSAKGTIEGLKSLGCTDFDDITDEYIYNCSEDELNDLLAKLLDKINNEYAYEWYKMHQ